MKTSELIIGSHVAYDYNESRDSHSYVQAYVIAHRPRGTRYTYYGTNGNADTVGIAYLPRWQAKMAVPHWDFKWVRPQTIGMPWTEYAETERRIAEHNKNREVQARKAKADRRKRIAALPKEVMTLFSEYQQENLLERDSMSHTHISVTFLEKLIAAAQQAHPAIRTATVQEEVEAALKLLG